MNYRPGYWINDEGDNNIMICELKSERITEQTPDYLKIEPGPCVDIVHLPDGSWEVEFWRRSDVESSGDETLYYGTDEFEVQQWILAAEHVADIYSHGKLVGDDHRVKALYAVVEERCW